MNRRPPGATQPGPRFPSPTLFRSQLYTKFPHNVEEGQISPIYGAAHRWFTAVLEKPAVTVVGKENSRLFEYFANRGDPKFPLHLVELDRKSTRLKSSH